MKLGDKQRIFARLILQLEVKMWLEGYETTVGDAKRPMDATYGHPESTHKYQLAKDINLFLDGKYLTTTEDHEEFGIWWEQQSGEGYECCWGGRFSDGNHYSIGHQGVR